ncbi:MAG: DUF448 domain-containing protein [Helicobacter sp.]|uniref:DUF448 domain-containing protein n=1 Tax=Helicobacter equorum TaxID=361872 RepID=A0A3D8IVJ6_9HELI|nr:DUF448 domain-containing protein [Helicobacter sp.]RDU68601.1 DUF448 domain-containing protein [Helicobacter equorum]
MCVACRGRFLQHTLQRFQVTQNTLCVFSGVGRSFYICAQCYQDPKALRGVMKRYNIQQITESKGV